MTVDIDAAIDIARPAHVVAAYTIDPENAPRWYVNIKSAAWTTSPPIAIGSRFEFVAHFLGRRLAYTYEVVELVADRRFVMRTAQGPFPMETTYAFDPVTDATTKMTLRNHGEPSGFAKVLAPVMASAMKTAMANDLARLKQILERSERAST